MARQRLGKGLGSLLPGAERLTEREDTARQELELSRIELNPKQPRQQMDQEALQGLADSIRRAGVLQPVVVRPRGEMFEIVMGERRLRAAHMAGLERIPAIVRDVGDDRLLELGLIENVQREDLNPIDKARAMRQMIQELSLTQQEAAEKLGLQRPTVANLLRLLELPEEIQQMVSRGTLTAGHARAVLSLQEEAQQAALARRIARQGLSVREAERLAAGGVRPPRLSSLQVSPQIRQLQSTLQERLGCRVEIKRRGKRGRIILHFGDHEEFDRLFDVLTAPRGQAQAAAG